MSDAAITTTPTDETQHALEETAKAWRSLGVGYALRDSGPPQEPESLLLSTAWLFAYDFHFASLVAAWVKYRSESLDLARLATFLTGCGKQKSSSPAPSSAVPPKTVASSNSTPGANIGTSTGTGTSTIGSGTGPGTTSTGTGTAMATATDTGASSGTTPIPGTVEQLLGAINYPGPESPQDGNYYPADLVLPTAEHVYYVRLSIPASCGALSILELDAYYSVEYLPATLVDAATNLYSVGDSGAYLVKQIGIVANVVPGVSCSIQVYGVVDAPSSGSESSWSPPQVPATTQTGMAASVGVPTPIPNSSSWPQALNGNATVALCTGSGMNLLVDYRYFALGATNSTVYYGSWKNGDSTYVPASETNPGAATNGDTTQLYLSNGQNPVGWVQTNGPASGAPGPGELDLGSSKIVLACTYYQ